MNPKIFKAYDIRGKYPDEINEEAVFEIAVAIGRNLLKASAGGGSSSGGKSRKALPAGRQVKAKLVVGRDTRLSSPALYKAVLNGLKHSNVLKNVRMKIIKARIVTTPMFYFLVNKLKADGGIMVTASHNPKEYNGLKIVREKAIPISGEEVKKWVL